MILLAWCALGRVDEHDLPVALQQRTVALADIEIRHGQPVAGHGRRGDAGRSRGARVGGCVVAAVAEPRGEARDDEREHDGDQMIFGLRIAAASGLGHGSHLLFDDKSVRMSQPFRSLRKAPCHGPLHGKARTARFSVRRTLCSECMPAALHAQSVRWPRCAGRGTQKCLRKRIRRHFLISQVKLQPRGCPLHGTVQRSFRPGFYPFSRQSFTARMRAWARALGRLGRGDVHLHAAHLQIRLGPAQRRLGAGQVNVRRGLGRAGEHGHGVGGDVHRAGAHGAVVLRAAGSIAHDAAHERAEQRRVARQDAGLPVGEGERDLLRPACPRPRRRP